MKTRLILFFYLRICFKIVYKEVHYGFIYENKSNELFTESEQTFIDFIFNHPYDVIQLNLQQLSKTSYVSISTIYRVMEKLEINGLNQLKLQISESLKIMKI